jgi:hypothetical protein
MRSGSSSSVSSSSSSTIPSKFGAVAALGTSITVAVNSVGWGELASNRLNTLMELRRGTRVAFDREFRCTLAERSSAWSEALSWAGSRCEGWLPMVTSRSLICRAGDRLWRGLPLSGERGGIGGGARSTSRVCGDVEARLVSLIACFSL